MGFELYRHLGLQIDVGTGLDTSRDRASAFITVPPSRITRRSGAQVRSTSVPPQCFSLHNSKYCGGSSGSGYGDHRMSTLVTISGQHVVDAGDFDKVLDQYFGSPDELRYINSFFGCQSWAGQPKPRYRIAYTCRSILESAEARACNQDYKPQPLCASACNSYVGEWSALTSDTDMCTNTTLTESNRQSLAESCESWPYDGKDGECVSNIKSETEICGFSTGQLGADKQDTEEIHRMCEYCKATDRSRCCRLSLVDERCSRLPTATNQALYLALMGIMGLLLSLIFTLVVWYLCQRNRANCDAKSQIFGSQATSKSATLWRDFEAGSAYNSTINTNTNVQAGAPLRSTSLALIKGWGRLWCSFVPPSPSSSTNSFNQHNDPGSADSPSGACSRAALDIGVYSVYSQDLNPKLGHGAMVPLGAKLLSRVDNVYTLAIGLILRSDKQATRNIRNNRDKNDGTTPNEAAAAAASIFTAADCSVSRTSDQTLILTTHLPKIQIYGLTMANFDSKVSAHKSNLTDSETVDKYNTFRSAIGTDSESDDNVIARDMTIRKRDQSLRGCPEVAQAIITDVEIDRGNTCGPKRESEKKVPSVALHAIYSDAESIDSDLFTVLYPYSSVEGDELTIKPGEKIRLLRLFSDGWTFVQRTDDGRVGAVPAVCLDTDPGAIVEYASMMDELAMRK
ncbi:hypothetical protein LPJ66_001763 [Kickxella alabastrina]|uniref:Uncharacterized protein n=1 Tax=Kickxella alabastrina TaxID=61397 RepID=A0ACC1ISB8_9FUNG|nr:hypothetical protein LPJ66_001763 [Kickxella alabastrina]